jgi:hypothetical protein
VFNKKIYCIFIRYLSFFLFFCLFKW